MAATGTAINGTAIIVQISEDSGSTFDTVGKATSASLSWSMSPRDVSTKDSAGRKEILSGQSEWSVSFDGFVSYATVSDVDMPNDIFTLADAKTTVKIRYGSLNTGDFNYQGDGYFSSYNQEAGVEDNNTFSVEFSGTSTLTQAAQA